MAQKLQNMKKVLSCLMYSCHKQNIKDSYKVQFCVFGGYVRDILAEIVPEDLDIIIYGDYKEGVSSEQMVSFSTEFVKSFLRDLKGFSVIKRFETKDPEMEKENYERIKALLTFVDGEISVDFVVRARERTIQFPTEGMKCDMTCNNLTARINVHGNFEKLGLVTCHPSFSVDRCVKDAIKKRGEVMIGRDSLPHVIEKICVRVEKMRERGWEISSGEIPESHFEMGEEQCPICHEEKKKYSLIAAPCCPKFICIPCVKGCLAVKKECPCCRQKKFAELSQSNEFVVDHNDQVDDTVSDEDQPWSAGNDLWMAVEPGRGGVHFRGMRGRRGQRGR